MQARAVARYIRMSPRKLRRTVDLIKGLPLKEARSLLDVMPHRAARTIRRVLDSAAANAENNHGMERDDLWVARAHVDEGPTLKRWRPASGGRVGMIRKRISHISVVVSDEEEKP
jgi:large subunit ribosomal protein L22